MHSAELDRLLERLCRLPVCALAQGVMTCEIAEEHGLLGFTCARPMMGEISRDPGEIGNVCRLDRFGNRPMKGSSLSRRQQAVGNLLGDDVLEQIGQVRLIAFERGEIESAQVVEFGQKGIAFAHRRMHLAEHDEAEHPPNHRGHFDRELFCGGEPIDTARHDAVQCVRKRDVAEVGVAASNATLTARDLDDARITQCKDQFFAEERVALGPLGDKRGQGVRNRRDPKTIADHVGSFFGAHRLEQQHFNGPTRCCPELARGRRIDGSGSDDREHW